MTRYVISKPTPRTYDDVLANVLTRWLARIEAVTFEDVSERARRREARKLFNEIMADLEALVGNK